MDNKSDSLSLNFFPLVQQDFSIPVFRKINRENEKINDFDIGTYSLPINDGNETYNQFFVSLKRLRGYESELIQSKANYEFTNWFLYQSIAKKISQINHNNKIFIDKNRFYKKRVYFVLFKDDLGKDLIWLEPYYLKITDQFGFLCRFKFEASVNVSFTSQYKDVLIRSLSLKKNGKRNVDFYADQYQKIGDFFTSFHSEIFPIIVGDNEIDISYPLGKLSRNNLQTKIYEFKNSIKKKSQFVGLKEAGPLKTIDNIPMLFFVFRDKEKNLSYSLHDALIGKKFPTFPGLPKMFGIEMNKEVIRGVPIPDYTENSIKVLIGEIQAEVNEKKPIVIMLIPDALEEVEYYKIKYLFLKERIASQFVTFNTVASNYSLKWAISNIALGIFAKLGGTPWKMSDTNRKGLIIGMGQSHRIDPITKQIERYFAYSILTDTSGTAQQLHVLTRTSNKQDYLSELEENLSTLLRNELSGYKKIAIHTPFNFKRDEMKALRNAIDKNTKLEKGDFAILRFDEKSKFIAFDKDNNSLTPYESSYVELCDNEYLVWFEGMQYHNPNIRTQISLPMHINIEYPEQLSSIQQKEFLQDALNLSGANWRGFNAKTSPISYYYSRLVAKYVKYFDLLGYSDFEIEKLPLWFL